MMTVDELAQNQLFEGLTQEELQQIAPLLIEETFEAEEILFAEGAPGDSLYLVLEGSIRISKEGRGEKQEVLTVLNRGTLFGEMSLFDSEPRSARATAQEKSRLAKMDSESLSLAMHASPGRLTQNFVRNIVKRLRDSNKHFIDQLLLTERTSLVGTMAQSIIHDFKNPMSAIVCACDMLRHKAGEKLADQMTGIIQKSVDRMLIMTQDLLDFSRGTSSIQFEQRSVPELMEGLEEQFFAHLPPEIVATKEIAYNETLTIDLAKFERVLLNILKNAKEAFSAGGVILFSIRLEDKTVVFEIADNGCGVPDSVRERIFEPFVTHGKSNGTGLGMAIVKNIVDAHHGTIEMESQLNVGTRFMIKIPLQQANPPST